MSLSFGKFDAEIIITSSLIIFPIFSLIIYFKKKWRRYFLPLLLIGCLLNLLIFSVGACDYFIKFWFNRERFYWRELLLLIIFSIILLLFSIFSFLWLCKDRQEERRRKNGKFLKNIPHWCFFVFFLLTPLWYCSCLYFYPPLSRVW